MCGQAFCQNVFLHWTDGRWVLGEKVWAAIIKTCFFNNISAVALLNSDFANRLNWIVVSCILEAVPQLLPVKNYIYCGNTHACFYEQPSFLHIEVFINRSCQFIMFCQNSLCYGAFCFFGKYKLQSCLKFNLIIPAACVCHLSFTNHKIYRNSFSCSIKTLCR